MKRKAITFILILALALCCTVSAFASELDYVTDLAGLLTEGEELELENLAREVSQTYGCGVYVITVADYTQNGGNNGIFQFAKDIYTAYDLGEGEGRDGTLLMLSMAERDYSLIAYGDLGNASFTDYGKSALEEQFLDNFRIDDWYGGFYDYIYCSGQLLQMSANGEPYDIYNAGSSERVGPQGFNTTALLIGIVVGAMVAGVACMSMKKKMQTAVAATKAAQYITASGIAVNVRDDVFTHVTETRQVIERETRSGGGTSVGSDGFSGSSGKF